MHRSQAGHQHRRQGHGVVNAIVRGFEDLERFGVEPQNHLKMKYRFFFQLRPVGSLRSGGAGKQRQ
jgi:hypothetical protein